MQQITLKHRVINSVLLILMLVTLSPTKISLANSQSSATLPVVDKKYVAGELLIRLQPGIVLQSSADGVTVSAAGVNDLFQKYNVTAAEPLFPNSEATSQGLERTYKVSLAADADMLSFLADLSADASVEYAEPDRKSVV